MCSKYLKRDNYETVNAIQYKVLVRSIAHYIGFSGGDVVLVASCLSNRLQRVRLKNKLSTMFPVTTGVP